MSAFTKKPGRLPRKVDGTFAAWRLVGSHPQGARKAASNLWSAVGPRPPSCPIRWERIRSKEARDPQHFRKRGGPLDDLLIAVMEDRSIGFLACQLRDSAGAFVSHNG
jgi:hypothetical protein